MRGPRSERPAGSGAWDGDPRAAALSGTSSREILHKIWKGDPLGLIGRCTRRLRERMLLLDATRLCTHAHARIAHDALGADRRGKLDDWLEAEVDRAIDELLREDHALDRQGVPVQPAEDSHYDFMCKTLGLSPMLGRKACVVFNRMPDEKRHALWAILIEGRSLEAHAEATGHSVDLVRHYFEDAALLFLSLGASGRPGPGNIGGGQR